MDKIKNIIEYFKKMFKAENNSKIGENLVIVIIIGVIVIIAGSTFFGGGSKSKKGNTGQSTEENNPGNAKEVSKLGVTDEKTDIEKSIEGILSQIGGAGKVDVLVTYVSGKEIVPYSDIKKSDDVTDEKDSTGGTRKINQSSYESEIAYEDNGNGEKKPIIVKELLPEVKGVVVVADGASDAVVKEKLVNAVKVLLGVPIHKIQVFERKGN
ncbi:stage III sporulation protein AG [Acetivibrio cellulolyticus]|uniref:stage III sporulation protein AG n=1 Tax=Acetivibrio cellulolyticus TaxID=35830 RepID=UPI0001E2D900|nr:stage III sporulation protein AG [Acetivibrio cellulolyticus]